MMSLALQNALVGFTPVFGDADCFQIAKNLSQIHYQYKRNLKKKPSKNYAEKLVLLENNTIYLINEVKKRYANKDS